MSFAFARMKNYGSSYNDLKHFNFISLDASLEKKKLEQAIEDQFSIGNFVYNKSSIYDSVVKFQTPVISFNLK
jgi:hypothetical protein